MKKVVICEDEQNCITPEGKIFPVMGVEIKKTGKVINKEVFYKPEEAFTKAVLKANTKHRYRYQGLKIIITG